MSTQNTQQMRKLAIEQAKIQHELRAIRVRMIRLTMFEVKDPCESLGKLVRYMEALVMNMETCKAEFDDMLDQIEAKLNIAD
jgi:hypothetical protein